MPFLSEAMTWSGQGLSCKAWGTFAAIASILIVTPSQAQLTATERAEIEQFYLDAYSIGDATFSAYEDPAADNAAIFEQCLQQVNALTVPDYMLAAAQEHNFNDYGESGWVDAFCDQVTLNYIFFNTGSKFD